VSDNCPLVVVVVGSLVSCILLSIVVFLWKHPRVSGVFVSLGLFV